MTGKITPLLRRDTDTVQARPQSSRPRRRKRTRISAPATPACSTGCSPELPALRDRGPDHRLPRPRSLTSGRAGTKDLHYPGQEPGQRGQDRPVGPRTASGSWPGAGAQRPDDAISGSRRPWAGPTGRARPASRTHGAPQGIRIVETRGLTVAAGTVLAQPDAGLRLH
jgi:hypothetical protein